MAYYYQQQPFYNPQIPFTGSIQGGLRDGKSITISGRVLPGANRFHVNLQCGSSPDANIALHINPRYDSSSGYIVTNTKQNNYWGTEERIYQALFPTGTPFNLQILVTSHSYKLSVNGIHIMDYKHRIPFNMVDTIVVDGMVEVNIIGFQDAVGIVPAQAGFQPQFAYPPGYGVPAFPAPASYSVPYKTIIIGGLQPGKNISIQGVVNPQASRFAINLRHRSGIAFHYNPRFDENLVVRNTQTIEQWGTEERSGGMPFHRGQNFQIIISCNPYHYNVFVNGKQVHTYNHRFTRLNEIDVLEVSGDMSLIAVNV
ncbi:galectin-9 isoform X1 [Pangasianodon hypophthalmus]|uniref:galectin-9 isoform X1 n=1 Tax=Pangasianodon hypophthalmus TaxID=310915 RepID=UPI000EFF14A6|nr:galectin-9 isoform X1 [Pangasianodon hypophthalmus]